MIGVFGSVQRLKPSTEICVAGMDIEARACADIIALKHFSRFKL